MEPEPSSLLTLLASLAPEGGRCEATIPTGWEQGRSVFGGLTSALLLRAMRSRVDAGRRPRALSLAFVKPVTPGSMELATALLRRGGSVTHVEGRLLQDGEVALVALGAFGEERRSTLRVAAPRPPEVLPPEELEELPFVDGVTPEFTRRLTYRWAIGDMPFQGSGHREMGGWCRFRDEPGPATEETVLALLDAWPAPVLPHLDAPAPASTLSWSVELVDPPAEVSPDDWWLYRAEVDHAAAGYAQTRAALWSARGDLVALRRARATYSTTSCWARTRTPLTSPITTRIGSER